MRKLFTFGCLWTVGAMLWAQPDEAKYRELMKQIGPATGALNKKIAAKDGTAADDAHKLQALFGEVQEFWKARNAADAITFAEDAAAGFGTVGELAASGKWDDAGPSLKKTTANCAGCHTAHREKADDGSFKIK
jgi:cytochrome c556